MEDIKYILFGLLVVLLLFLMAIQGKCIWVFVFRLLFVKGVLGYIGVGKVQLLWFIIFGESMIVGIGVEIYVEGFSGILVCVLADQLGKLVEWKVYVKSGYIVEWVMEKLVL